MMQKAIVWLKYPKLARLNNQIIRFCPNCDTQLDGPDTRKKWICPNHPDKCDVIYVVYPPLAHYDLPPVRIVQESRPRLKVII